MKKQALAISAALVLGLSANAFAGMTFSGKIYGDVAVSQWNTSTAKLKSGDSVISNVVHDITATAKNSGTSADKKSSWSYTVNLGYLMDENSGKSLSLNDYKASITDPYFTVTAWGKKANGGAKSDIFGWVKSDAVKNSADTDSGNAKVRIETPTGYSLDVDNKGAKSYKYMFGATAKEFKLAASPTAWLFYNTKVGKADVGLGVATILAGQLVQPERTVVAYGTTEVVPKVTVSGEIGMSNAYNDKVIVNAKDGNVAYLTSSIKPELGANGAAGAKVSYVVSDKLTTNAFASARGAEFREYNNKQALSNDRAEYGADATYKMGDTTITAKYATAQHTTQMIDAKTKYNDDAASSLSVSYKPAAGITGSVSYTVTTADKAAQGSVTSNPIIDPATNSAVITVTPDGKFSDQYARIAWATSASGKFLQDKLSVTANLKWTNDHDGNIDPGNYYDNGGRNGNDGAEIFGSQRYAFYRDANVTATYNYDANNTFTATLQSVNVKDFKVEDFMVKEYAKYTRKVDKASVALEYSAFVIDNDEKIVKHLADGVTRAYYQDVKTTLSLSVPF